MNKRLLEKTVLAVVLGGTFATNWASAAPLTITGTAQDTAATTGAKTVANASTTNVENNKPTYKKYTYSGDAVLDGITLAGTNAWLVNAKSKVLTVNGVALEDGTGMAAVSVTDGGDFNFTSTATTTSDLLLNTNVSTSGDAYGFYLKGSSAKKSLGYMPFITTKINSVTSGAGAYGLYADNSIFVGAYGTAVKDFAIGSQSGSTINYGVSTTAAGTDKAAGIYAVNNSNVLLPKYTAYVKGNGAVAESGSKIGLGSDKAGSTVTIYVDKNNTDNYAALSAKGGQIDVDLQDKWAKGEITYGADPKGLQTNINGNLVAEGGHEAPSLINISLTNAASTWEGVAHSTGNGNINLWLGNGASWTNEQWGNQKGFSGSHIHELKGGVAGQAGFIVQKDSNDVTIDEFSGNVKVFYEHENNGSAASDYAAGDIRINSAAAASGLTLITDNKNIDLGNTQAVENSLNTLAGKLTYLGFASGTEDNITGCVQIAEGLTASSATLKEGFIAFAEGTGKGSYEAMYKDEQTKTELGNQITGSTDIDKAYIKAGILREDGKYHFDKDSTITLNASGTEYRGITNTDDVVIEGAGKDITLNVTGDATSLYGIKQDDTAKSITITAKNLNINAEGSKRVEAINLYNTDIDNASTMNIDGNVNIYAHAGGTALMGIHAVANSYVNITGDLNIKNPNTEDGKWGTNAYGSNDKTIGNSYFGNAAVYVHSGMANCQKSGGVNVGGDVDIVAQAGGLYINGGGGVINIEGGGRIETDPTVYQAAAYGDAAYAAIRAESGHVYMNVVKDTEGAVKGNVTGAGTHKVNILGNIDTTAGAYNVNLEPSTETTVSVGLATEDSSWTGVAYNAFPDGGMGGTATSGTWKGEERKFTGAINVWLQNGATWTNEEYGTVEKPYAGLNFNDYGSRLAKLVGSESQAKAGVIYQKDSRPITIDEYSGNTKVFYEHTNDGDEAADYSAGDITIKKAAADSAITLITDNSGIANVAKAHDTLNTLANKLTYAAYVEGEKNLSGKVEIAEGLTSSSASMRLENMTFDAETGKGMYEAPKPPEHQTVFDFSDPILGNRETDTAYIEGGVLREDDIYRFEGDTTIDSAGASVEKGLYGSAGTAIIDASSVNQHTVLDLQGHNLNVKGSTATGLIDIMATGVVDTNTKQLNIGTVEINNPGQIVLEASRTGASGYPTPVYVNGGGKIVIHNGEGDLDSKVVTIKSETPNNDQFCGIKTMNGVKDGRSQVIIDGLVDIETSAYRANPGTNIEGISNVASTVSVGGGTIKLTNEDANGQKGNGLWAIRSYGEFTSSNPGYVYFNAVHEGVEGAATGSGTNKAVIEGGIGMSGSMNVIGSINVGFGTADSYFKGDVRSTGSYGAAQGNGAVNLWFTPGSSWEGNNISKGHDTNVYLDGANWTGYSDQESGTTKAGAPIGFNLELKNGSVWKNTGDSYALSVKSNGSVIDMTDAAAGNVVIDNYSGDTKVFYAHTNDGDEAADYSAGDITIKKAAADSEITLITDNSGIANVAKAHDTLNTLANKLTYAAYVDGEENLSGKVEIAEGLTSSSVAMRLENMTFDAETGKGMYVAPPRPENQTVFVYDAAVDNNETDDQEYVEGGVLKEDGTYEIEGATTIALKDVATAKSYIMSTNKKDLTIDAGNNSLKTSIEGTTQIYGLLQNDNNKVDITASKFTADVTSTGRAEAISVTNTDAEQKAVVNITADTALTANAGSGAAIGIHATGNSEVNINGNLTMKGDDRHSWGVALEKGGYSYFGAAALYSHNSYGSLQKSGDINVKGLVDIEAYANGAYVNGGGGTINIAGGSIKMNKEDTAKGYAALRAESGHINMNMNADNTAAGANKVNIQGNVATTAGAYNLNLEPCEESVVNLGMATKDSSWTGVAYNAFPEEGLGGTATSGTWKGEERKFTGEINLWLTNGATWNNELYGITEKAYAGNNFEGSHLAKLTGGSSAANAGIIFQKDANPLTIDAYSGNTKVFFEHTNDGDEAADYAAGDITIKTAAANSAITLITDNAGISDVAKADDTLNALANKLTYAAYAEGEKNLSGKVEISEGLTSSSASLRLEDMSFKEESGQGYYENPLPPGPGPDPVDPDEPIDSEGKILTGTMYDKSFMKSKISEAGDQVNYDLTKKDYTFLAYRAEPGSKSVANLAPGGTLTLGGEEAYGVAMLINDGAEVTVNGNLNLSASSESYAASGISMMVGGTGVGEQSHLLVNGHVTMGDPENGIYGVSAEDKHGAYDTYMGTRWTGTGINVNQGHGSTLTITDGVTMLVDGHGIVTDPYYTDANYEDKDLTTVNVNGPVNIKVEAADGEDVGLYSLANYGGTINVGMKDGKPAGDDVKLYGNTLVMKDTYGEDKNPYFYRTGVTNLALTTADSEWTGVIDNTGTQQAGEFNLYLQNGATWNYQEASKTNGLSASTMPQPSINYYGAYDGISHVAKLVGGTSEKNRGIIKMNSNDNIEVDNYSGNTIVLYEHDGSQPTSINGGDFKVKLAELGSVITLSTDRVGITEANNEDVMNALAGKLYYLANDNSLIGKVQIAEGLTAASETLYSGSIGFAESNGQGFYSKKVDPVIIDGAIGEAAADSLFNVTETENAKTYSFDEAKMVSVKVGAAVRSDEAKTIVVANEATLLLGSEDETSPIIDATKGDIDIQGEIKATATEGQDIAVVGADKKLNIAGADLAAEDGKVLDMAGGSVVNLGVKDNNGTDKALEPTGKPVKVEGTINNNGGTLNMALATADSQWKGDYQGQADEMNLSIDKDSSFKGSVNGEKLNINLNQGTWVNTGASESSTGELNLTAGGTGKAKLDMSQGSGDLKIDNYSGGMTIFYGHDKNDPTSINGGNVTIGSAAEKSEVNLLTTDAGVDTDNEAAIKDTLKALANKLYYTNYNSEGPDNKGNLSGKVGIGEGLTRPEAFTYWSGLQFNSAQAGIDGKLQDNKPHGDIIYGDKETGMMRGAKMAMASTAMVWREESNDLLKRMGDLRLRKEEAGIWAKYYSGRNEYSDKGSFKNKYKAVQVGADKELGHGWLGGVAFSYDDGSTHMNNGGYGDVSVYNFGVYGTKLSKNGEFIDVIAKAGKLENKYTIYNDYGYSLDGEYNNTGLSLSMEYGKKISLKDGLVLTPSAEFTMGRIGSKNYDAYSEHYKKQLHIKQDAFNSAVGRVSLSLGKETDKYSYFAKASLAHEFGGDFNTSYKADGEPTSQTSMDFKGSWKEIQVGGSVKLNNDAMLYGTFGRSFGGTVTEKWRIDAGINLAFNHLSDFFGGKHKEAAVEAVAEPVAPAMSENASASAVAENAPVKAVDTAEVQAAAAPVAEVYAQDNSSQAQNNDLTIRSGKEFGEFYLDEYIVTANRTPQRITDATADVSVVTRTELEEKHIANVEEALRTVPGVQFNNYGSGNQMNANISSLRINGSKDIAVLVDGVKINDFQGVGEAGNMYAGVLNNINNIERIEVLRGAAGVLYGSGAKGGVINIITREVDENKTVIDASVGSFNREDYKFNTMGSVGKFTYNLYQGTYRQGDVTDGRGDKWEGHTKTRNAGAKVTYKFTDNNKLTVDYMDINSRFGGTDLIYNNFYKGKFASTMWSIRDDWKIGEHWNNIFVYRQNEEKRQHRQEYFAGNKLTNANTDYKYLFISDQLNFSDDRHNLTLGVDYSKGKDQNYTMIDGVEAKRNMKNISVYANGEWKMLRNLTLTAGIRHDRPDGDAHGSEMASHTTKSYKLSWDISKNDTLYAGRSEYFILPSMNQLYDKEWGNAGLKPAEGRTTSVGYNKKFDDNNFFTVNYFQTKEDCGIGWDGYNRVNTNGISRGWNAQYTSRLSDKWDIQLGWAHLYERSGANDNYTYGYYPKDLATFGVNYSCGKFSSALDGRWFFRRKDDSGRREFPADNYGIYNISMNYKPTKNMKFYLKVENIFDKFYCEHTDAGNDPFLTGGGERKYYAMPGRAIVVGTQFTF